MKCVYKLKCKDTNITEFYIGSSIDFETRKRQHKSGTNNLNRREYCLPLYMFINVNGGFDNWDFEVIKEYKFITKKELNMNEQYYKELLKPELNSINAYGRDRLETNKKYYKNNKIKTNCPNCGKEMLKQSIKNHIRKWCKENKPIKPQYCYSGNEDWIELADILGIDLK